MKHCKSAVIILICIVVPVFSYAQADSVSQNIRMDGGLDFVSRYVWRGSLQNDAPAMQPWAEISWKNLTLGTWASSSISGYGLQEANLYLRGDFTNFVIELWDYYEFEDSLPGNYFDYRQSTTSHLFDL